jgi:SAM-dependent methyltransferase
MATNEHEDIVRQSFRTQVGMFSGPDSPYARREGALGWLEPLDPRMIALEVACGAAHVAEGVAASVRQVVGLDLTSELLAVGAARLRDAGVNNVLLQEGNAEALPFVDHSFDLVMCRASLHHFADPHGAVQQMVRVCRSGGRVVLMDLIAPSAPERERFDDLHRLLDPSHVRTFLEEELAAVFPTDVALSHGETTNMRLPIDIAVSELSDRDAVIAALRDEMDEGESTGFDPADEEGAIVVSFTTCVVHGTIS